MSSNPRMQIALFFNVLWLCFELFLVAKLKCMTDTARFVHHDLQLLDQSFDWRLVEVSNGLVGSFDPSVACW